MNLDNETIAKELAEKLWNRAYPRSREQLRGQIEKALGEMIVESGLPPPAPKFSKLYLAAFALETVAHMKGLEYMLIPHVEFIQKVDEALKAVRAAETAVRVTDARWCIEQLAQENER